MVRAYYAWLEENASEDDLIPGAFYNGANKQWVIYDYDILGKFLLEGE